MSVVCFVFFVVRQTRLSGEQVGGGITGNQQRTDHWGEIKQSHLFNFWDFVSPLHPCKDLHPTVPLLSHPQPSLPSCVQHPLILPSPPRPFISLPSPPLCLSPISLYQRRFSPLRPSLLGNPSAAWNEERERARDREWEKQKEREREGGEIEKDRGEGNVKAEGGPDRKGWRRRGRRTPDQRRQRQREWKMEKWDKCGQTSTATPLKFGPEPREEDWLAEMSIAHVRTNALWLWGTSSYAFCCNWSSRF